MLFRKDDGRFLRAASAAPPDERAVEEVEHGRFRATCDERETFTVDLATREAAAGAAAVFEEIQRSLAEAITWGAWPDGRRTRPRTSGELYFRGISDESRRHARALVREIGDRTDWTDDGPGHRSIRTVTVGDQSAYRVEVGEDSLFLAAYAATIDRAVAFLMLYTALQRDLREILGWEPL